MVWSCFFFSFSFFHIYIFGVFFGGFGVCFFLLLFFANWIFILCGEFDMIRYIMDWGFWSRCTLFSFRQGYIGVCENQFDSHD